jgi:fibronectin type 3 domain-containing protein
VILKYEQFTTFSATPESGDAMYLRKTVALATAAIVALGVTLLATTPAQALSPGVAFGSTALPTWQTNGEVYALASQGGMVAAGGTFTQLTPPSGSSATPIGQASLAIFNAATGSPASCQYPINFSGGIAGVYAMTAAPDGKSIYVGGNFSSIKGTTVLRLAKINLSTCSVVTTFKPAQIDAPVRGIGISPDGSTVYFAGDFSNVAGEAHSRFAAVDATTGAIKSSFVTSDVNSSVSQILSGNLGTGRAVQVSPDGTKVVVGGDFDHIDGQYSHSIAVVDAQTGALIRTYDSGFIPPTSTTKAITNDGDYFYVGNEGTGGGVFDGSFKVSWDTLDQVWRDTCLGATQAIVAYQGTLYEASHHHDCSSMNEYPDGIRHFFTANSETDSSLLGWFPQANDGIGEHIGPRALNVAVGTDGKPYLWAGGEFTQINGAPQQGLTRFGTTDANVPPIPTAKAVAMPNGTIQVRFRTVVDTDDNQLTYSVYRNGGTTPVWTGQATSWWWKQPQVTFTDTSVTPGTSYRYTVTASDGTNTSAKSAQVSATAVGAAPSYTSQVIADGAQLYWRYDDTSGKWIEDASGSSAGLNGLTQTGVLTGGDSAIAGSSDPSGIFNGSTQYAYSDQGAGAPSTYSIETWIKTTTTSGGWIAGYGNGFPNTGTFATNLSSNHDREIYMENSGRLEFGVWTGGAQTVESHKSYNDGNWHYIVGTQGPGGLVLYVDGLPVGTNPTATAQDYYGSWRVGGDNAGGWPNSPTSNFFAGQLDETAIYPTVLSEAQIQNHFALAGGKLDVNSAPADDYGKAVFNDDPSLYWRLDETAGSDAADSSYFKQNPGTYGSDVGMGVPGVVGNAASFNGDTNSSVYDSGSTSAPSAFTEEAWFKTTTQSGGKLIGFENSPTGNGSNYDKQVYMTNDGTIVFGVYVGFVSAIQSRSGLNDGKWHQVVATQDAGGMKLYIDGALVASNGTTANQSFSGYWRIAGGNIGGWPSSPSSFEYTGQLDEVAVYPAALSAASVAEHYGLGVQDHQPPTAVSGLSATGTSSGVQLDWTAATDNVGVAGYSVFRSDTAGFTPSSSNQIATVTSGTSYTDAGAPVGVPVYYAVEAVDAVGNTSAASTVSVTVADLIAPSTPGGVTATASDGHVDVSWQASTDNVGVANYRVFRGSSADFTPAGTPLAVVTGTSFSDTTATPGTYYYKVVAVDAAGNASDASAAASVAVPDSSAPTAPSGLTATRSGANVQLSWTASTDDVGVTGYSVYRSADSAFVPSPATLLAAGLGDTAYTDANAPAGTWYYAVTASDAAGNASAPSATASAAVPDTQAPGQPGELQAVASGPNVSLSWIAGIDNVGVTGYRVYRGTSAGFTPDATNLLGTVTDTSYSDTGLAFGTYYYAVESVDAAGNVSTPATTEVEVVPDTTPPSTPAGVTATQSGTSVNVAWTASTDDQSVSGYRVYRGASADFTPDASTLLADAVTGTSYTDASVAAGGPYYYKVIAVDGSGNASQPSGAASVTVADVTPPSTPGSVSAAPAGSGVTVSWSPSTDDVAVTGYDVYRGTSADFAANDGSKVGSTSGATQFTDPNVPGGTLYYKVVARDAAGNRSAASAAAVVTVTGPAQPVEVKLNPSDDAMVYQSIPNTNYGGYNQLSASGASSQVWSYLKFAMPTVPSGTTLTGATLSVRTSTDPSAGSTSPFTFSLVGSSAWSQSTLTWNNRPTAIGAAVGSLSGATATNTPYSVTLNAGQLSALAGQPMTLVITSTGSDNLRLWSNESTTASFRPQLTLDFTPTSSPVPDTAPPSTPTGVTAVANGSTVTLGWTASTDNVGVVGYNVYRGSSADFAISPSNRIGSPSTTGFSDSGLAAGTYYYKVTALDAAGNESGAGAGSATVTPGGSTPTTITQTATEDAMVYRANPGVNYGTNSQLSANGGTNAIKSLLKFAIPAAPAGKTLQSVTLVVRTSTDPGAGSGDQFPFSLLTSSWSQGTLTWNNFPTETGTALGVLSGASATNTPYSATLDPSAFASVLGGTASILVAGSATGTDNVRLWSSEASTASYRPQLVFVFQ